MLGISWGIVSVVMLLAYGNGFQTRSSAGFRGAFGDGVVIVWPGQTSTQAGGERAGKRIQLTEAGRAVGAGAAVREVREPGVHPGIPDDLGREAGLLPRARRRARIRDDAQPVGAGRPVPRRRRRAPAAAGGVHRQRGGPQDVRQRAAGGAAAAHRRHGVRGRRRAAREGAALQLHGLRQGVGLHPVHHRRAAVEHRVHDGDGLPGGGRVEGGPGDPPREGGARQAHGLRPRRRAGACACSARRRRRRSPRASPSG